jgi:hypothetical protein
MIYFYFALKNNVFFRIFTILRKHHSTFLVTLQLAHEDMWLVVQFQLRIIPISPPFCVIEKDFANCSEEKRHNMEEEVPNERWKMIGHSHHLHLWSWQVISFSFFL